MPRIFAARLLALLLVSLAVNAQVTFTQKGITTATGANSVAIADFNVDAYPDIATTSGSSGIFYVFTHNSSGGYSLADHHAVASPNQIDTADLNGDGYLDLVVGSQTQSSLFLFFANSSSATFSPAGTVSLSAPSHNFALGDFNHDGKIDIVVHACNTSVSPAQCSLKTYKNDGTGKFSLSQTLIATGTSLPSAGERTVVTGDFNRDGNLDIAVATNQGFNLYLGNGDGTFRYAYGREFYQGISITTGSFNHDSILDIADVLESCGTSSCNLSAQVLLNNGAASFGFRSKVAMAGPILASGDLTGDGVDDLLSMNPAHFGGVLQYMTNHGDGYFNSAQTATTTDTGTLPLVRDMNLDGRNDVVFAEQLGGEVRILTNQSAYVACTPPRDPHIRVQIHSCTPAGSATVPTTFRVAATGNSMAGVQRMEVWIDGKKTRETLQDKLNTTVTVAAGSHRLVVIAIDRYGEKTTYVNFITAQ